MGRWEPDARRRMQEAALELFAERGYARTTAAEVAERAGLTERTFFRHFPDKREVLFDGGDDLRDRLAQTVSEAPYSATPLEAITAGLEALAAEFRPRRDLLRKRARIVAAYPELRERELMKLASWSDALEDVLCGRGLSRPDAKLAAEVSVAVFRVAYGRWLDEGPERGLVATVHEALAGLGGFVDRTAPGPRNRPRVRGDHRPPG